MPNIMPTVTPASPLQNHLLAALPAEILASLSPHLDLIAMPLGAVLCESGSQLAHVYFPTTAILSLSYIMEDGASSEIAGVGNEGVLGIPLLLGGNTTLSRATVQTAGHGHRLKAEIMMAEFNRTNGCRASVLHNLMLRYTQAFITQIAQTAACNRHHSVEQQLCRWLLSTLDRLSSNELTMTQELIASMLGVRREAITEAAGNLQRAGLIGYRRGHITALKLPELEVRACECYAVVKNEFGRLLKDVRTPPRIKSLPYVR